MPIFIYLAVLVVTALLLDGVYLVLVHFWPLLLPVVVVVTLVLIYRHPGVKAKRELRMAAKRGHRARADIAGATASTKAEMARLAREYRKTR